jgi:hypothetical protein
VITGGTPVLPTTPNIRLTTTNIFFGRGIKMDENFFRDGLSAKATQAAQA